MNPSPNHTASHSFLEVFAANGVDRVFLVPGESYLGILDALNDVPALQVVTCRHEAGAGFMACADARLTGRPALVLVSRGPGATNASIAVHTAQQDAVPLVLVIGQVPLRELGREAFQEIDYQRMFGSIAKWVVEVREPEQLAEVAFKAVRMSTSGTPGPVVVVIPEDIQQQSVSVQRWRARSHEASEPTASVLQELTGMLQAAQRPLIVAGGGFESEHGRAALLAFAQTWQIPVAVSFRRHDVFPNQHPLYAGDLGLANGSEHMQAFHDSDLILALGTRMGDVTTQRYTFPAMPSPAQAVVHCHADPHAVGLNFAPRMGIVCDPVALAAALAQVKAVPPRDASHAWRARLRGIQDKISQWPVGTSPSPDVVRSLARHRQGHTIVCLDAGSFAAPVYRHFSFNHPERLLAPISGAMGFGTPAAIAAQLRCPQAKVICLVGDGGFMMTGNEMIAAVERRLPILFVVVDNNAYGSIWIHQAALYPGRHVGTTLSSPDFALIAAAFGMPAETVTHADEVDAAVQRGLRATTPYLLHVKTQLPAARASSDKQPEPAATWESN